MVDPKTGCGLNQFSLDFVSIPAIAIHRTWNAEREGQSPEIPTDTTSYGHNIELAWLLNRALFISSIDPAPYREVIYRLADHSHQYGVDWEYGGLYRDGVAAAGPIISEKEFWQNSEALVGFLDAYTTFREERFLYAYENVWAFVNNKMFNHEVSEIRTLLTREGEPIDGKIGNPWKVTYHSGPPCWNAVRG